MYLLNSIKNTLFFIETGMSRYEPVTPSSRRSETSQHQSRTPSQHKQSMYLNSFFNIQNYKEYCRYLFSGCIILHKRN